MTSNLLKVGIPVERNANGFPPIDREWVWAKPISESTAQLDNVPFFSTWSFGDVVEIAREDDQWIGVRVVHEAGNKSTLLQFQDPETLKSFRALLRRDGIPHEAWADKRLVAVNISPGLGDAGLTHLLAEFRRDGVEIFSWR